MAVVRIKIDVTQVKAMLGRTQAVLRDRRGLLNAIAEWMRLATRRAFEGERSPEGRRWKPLSPKYAEFKQRAVGRRPMLRFSGALFSSRRHGVTRNTAFLELNRIYAAVHQYGHQFKGRRRIPARPYLPSIRTVEREGAKIVEEHLEDAIKGKTR